MGAMWHEGTSHGGILGDIRQFRRLTCVVGAASMKTTKRVKRPESFAAGVGRALRLAAKSARKIARMYGTPIYTSEGGKVVAKKP
jgi:hypothetical protein